MKDFTNFRTLAILLIAITMSTLSALAQPTVNCQATSKTLSSGGSTSVSPADIDNGSGAGTRYISRAAYGYTEDAKIGSYAFSLDGDNDAISLDSKFNFSYYHAFTVEAWVKTTDADGIITGRSLPYSPYSGWSMKLKNGELVFNLTSDHNGGRRAVAIATGSTINDGQWHHVAAVHSYTYGTATGIDLYIDGQPWTGTTYDGLGQNQVSQYSSSYPAKIGSHSNGSNPLKGLIDELRIWDEARTASEISSNRDYALTGTLPSTLKAYYDMETVHPVKLTDEDGYADGTISGIYTSGSQTLNQNDTESPISNYYASFDGVDDRIQFSNGHQYEFQPTEAFTWELWVKTEDSPGYLFRAGDNVNGYGGYGMYITSDKLRFEYFNRPTGGGLEQLIVQSTASGFVTDNQWHHVALSYDGSTDASGVTLYVDGEAISLTTIADNLSSSSINFDRKEPNLGAPFNTNNTIYFLEGKMEDVRIWDEERTAAEITQYMQTPLHTDASLVGFFPWTAGTGIFEVNQGSGTGSARMFNGATWEDEGASAIPFTLTVVNTSNQAAQCTSLVTVNPHGASARGTSANTTTEQIATEPTFSLYPNPTQGRVKVQGQGEFQVEVLDLQGRQISQAQGYQEVSLDISNEETGLYLLRITDENGEVSTQKLMKR